MRESPDSSGVGPDETFRCSPNQEFCYVSDTLFGSRSKARLTPVLAQRLGCECLDDRVVPAVLVNEVVVNPPGTSGEIDREYIELRVTGTIDSNTLNNLSVAVLEGEGGSNNPGNLDAVINLSSHAASFAASGKSLIFIANNTHDFTPSADAYVIATSAFEQLENGAMSVAVVETSATLTVDVTDLDDDDDGVIDTSITVGITPYSVTTIDAVGYTENASEDFAYGFDVTPANGQDPDVIVRDASYTTAFQDYVSGSYNSNAWYAGELSNESTTGGLHWDITLTFGSGTTTPSVTTAGDDNE